MIQGIFSVANGLALSVGHTTAAQRSGVSCVVPPTATAHSPVALTCSVKSGRCEASPTHASKPRYLGNRNRRGIQDGGRISRLIATTALAHLQITRGSDSPAKAADAVRLQHGPLRALHGFLVAPARIGAASASTGGPRKKTRASARPKPALLFLSTERDP
ncbi:hypothetical protein NDU88_006731 [Pleurodeles waltl]|uniref:Uncharacterized protein n=1 Tax=Pleurodeles waltl TaxID=8319 RepID=A0AAV7MFT7_PLEWA|nr:hypothetical protein NDU88_006731 [Pleurodeles waltl]